jgi:GTP-binding protein EngB required for normal cell division
VYGRTRTCDLKRKIIPRDWYPMATYRVLVFGSTGTGKTSLCNELTGQQMMANSSARGNTFETHTYDPFSDGKNTFVITDTVGLNESSSGTVPAKEAAAQLVNLLAEAKDGFSILVHVFRIPRVTEAHDKNYQFFVTEMTQGNIPVILIATGCENEEPMSAWANDNAKIFASGGHDYKQVLATCFCKGGKFERNYAPLRRESRAAVIDAIIQHGLAEPHMIYGGEVGFDQVLTRIWNSFVGIAGLPKKYRKKVNESGVSLLIRLGVPKAVAEGFAEQIPGLIEKGVKAGVIAILPVILKPFSSLISDAIISVLPGSKSKAKNGKL